MITCSNCGRANPEGARYCASCRVNMGDAAPKDAHGRPIYRRAKRRGLWERLRQLVRR